MISASDFNKKYSIKSSIINTKQTPTNQPPTNTTNTIYKKEEPEDLTLKKVISIFKSNKDLPHTKRKKITLSNIKSYLKSYNPYMPYSE